MTTPDTTVAQSARQMSFAEALRHYEGHPRAALTPREGEPDDNLIISLARTIVDKGAAFLFGKDVLSQVTSAEPEPKQDYLDRCWRRNKRALTLQKLATNGGIYGHAFVRLLESTPEPRVIVLDSSHMELMSNPDDLEDIWRFTYTPPPPEQQGDDGEDTPARRIVVQNPSGTAGQAVITPGPWEIKEQHFVGSGWLTDVTRSWPYSFCPIIHCQNLPRANDVWGESDLPSDILKMLDSINRIASQYAKIIRIHSHPKVWARGMGKSNLNVSVDSVIVMPSEAAELKILEMQSDLGSTMALLEKLLELLSMMVRIPLVALGVPDNQGSPSGVSLQIRYQPLIEKTEAKQRNYGDLMMDVDRALLTMGGFGDATTTTLVWPEVMPKDPLVERQAWVIDESLGLVSRETLSNLAGYDYDQEQKRLANERQSAIDVGLTAPSVPPPVPAPAAFLPPLPDTAKTAPEVP